MLKLVSNLIKLGLITLVILAGIILLSPHDTNNYLAAVQDKHALLSSVESPRIIFVGGSNLAFSIDSERIQDRFGLSVVNTGVHGDVGLRFMLNEVQSTLRNGDIVVICPEYEQFYEIPLDGLPRELGSVIKFCPECISSITTPGQLFNVATGLLQTSEGDLLRLVRRHEKPDRVYFRGAFNEWGDVISHLDKEDQLLPNNYVYEIQVSSAGPAIDLLNTFHQSGNAAGARIFFMFPAIPLDEYQAQEDSVRDLYERLQSELGIPMLGTPEDFIYPEDYFYDTVYHMNAVGRDARASKIIEFLTTVIQD